jgi:PAS domain-containing protein
LQAVLDSSSDYIFCKDTQGIFFVCNTAFANDFFGTLPDFVLDKSDHDLLPDKAVADQMQHQDQEIFQSGETRIIEKEMRLADGRLSCASRCCR